MNATSLVADPQPASAPYCWRLPRTDAGCTSLGHPPTVGLPCPESHPGARRIGRIDGGRTFGGRVYGERIHSAGDPCPVGEFPHRVAAVCLDTRGA